MTMTMSNKNKGLFVFSDVTKTSNQIIKFKVSSLFEIQDLVDKCFYKSVYLIYFFLSSEEKFPSSFVITDNKESIQNIVFLMKQVREEHRINADFNFYVVDCGTYNGACLMLAELKKQYSN